MTRFFHYDELTWPEVKDLPRDTPLVVPLGSGYNLEELERALGSPPLAGLLPPIPYGWQGSGLVVQDHLLGDYLANLLENLQEDGFSRVYALKLAGSGQLGSERAIPWIYLSPINTGIQSGWDSNSEPLPGDGERGKVVLIPIGHTEQHGYHLPLSTDTLIIEAIARGTAASLPGEASALPVMPYGVSTHRQAFAGTLNAGGRAFEDFWLGVIDALVQRGFDRFYLLSGHGGNCSFLVNVAKYAGERFTRIFCATAWLYLSGPQGVEALESRRRSARGGMGHAGELETSLILHLRPDLVHLARVVDEIDYTATPSYYMDWVEGGALVANPPWYDDTATGAYGAGSLATAENGEFWLQAAIAEKAGHIAEIHEQHKRRELRRRSGFGQYKQP